MRILTAVVLLLAVTATAADDTRLHVSATILSRCETSAADVARCNGVNTRVPYRVRRHGGMLTIEF